jgi:hypothetical protein
MSIHKIAAKLTVLCAILDERETAESDLAESRLPTALRLARETSALASAEQTRLEKASAAWALALTRTAMLTEAMPPADPHWVELCVTLDLTPAQWETYRPLLHVEDGVRVTVEPVAHVERTGAEVSAQPAAPLRPAEGAAAERERRAEQSSGVEWMPLSKASVLWSQCTGKPEPSQPRWCSCGKPRPYVGGTLCKCMDCGGFCDIAEPEPVAQPRDLAGRIRSLLLRWCGAWASLGVWDVQTDAALRSCLDILREAHRAARGSVDCRPIPELVAALREFAASAYDVPRPVVAQVADEFEAIVRDEVKS